MSNKNKAPTKRVEYRGENIRVSRTGGVAARKNISKKGYGATINTNQGIRFHKRLFRGARIGLQNGNFQFIGRFSKGPFNFNVSKSGVSTSIKNKRGTYNIFKPNYSSFKLGGIQIRGKNAKTLQLIYLFFILALNTMKFFWYIFINILWFSFLIIKWIVDFFVGFYKGFKNNPKEIKVDSQ
ncbi:hypothetical protein [Haloflavibacter putidus]|uniref:DUF4236 domain-containing protein n=1 Tax=Haloflavibacter putidus TaxID=2576776 RepID=A0A507ZVM4_9FLAO|nr:hypothetical protein [Haloflavibacter putidus]TQD40294.1 hypothetical protein FKR84_03595 [Haloflavibacter putidus]